MSKKELLGRLEKEAYEALTSTMRLFSNIPRIWEKIPSYGLSNKVSLMLSGTVRVNGVWLHDTYDRMKCLCGNDNNSGLWLEHWLDSCRKRGAWEREQIKEYIARAC